jgi:hypothetical protein
VSAVCLFLRIVGSSHMNTSVTEQRAALLYKSHSETLRMFEEEYGKTPWPLAIERIIPTQRPPLVGEDSANFCG